MYEKHFRNRIQNRAQCMIFDFQGLTIPPTTPNGLLEALRFWIAHRGVTSIKDLEEGNMRLWMDYVFKDDPRKALSDHTNTFMYA